MTYKKIQAYVKENYGVMVQTCWIADVKEKMGEQVKQANNRISSESRVKPCPAKYEEMIKKSINFLK